MHDQPASSVQLTVGELTGLLAALTIHNSYYCDQGSHHGKTRVRLEGYLTGRQVSVLRTAGNTPGASGPGEPDTWDRCRHCGVLIGPGTPDQLWVHGDLSGGRLRRYDRCDGPAGPATQPAQPMIGHRLHQATIIAHRQDGDDTIVLLLAAAATFDRYITGRWRAGRPKWEHGRYFTAITDAVADWDTR